MLTKEQIARKLYESNRIAVRESIHIELEPWEESEYGRKYWTKIVEDSSLFEELSTIQSPPELHKFCCKVAEDNLMYIEVYFLKFLDEIAWFRDYVHPPENFLTGKRFKLLVSKRRFEFICNGILTGNIKFLDGRKETITIQMKDLREMSKEEE